MALAGIEVCYLVRRMAGLAEGHYVANVYGVNRKTLLIKMHHPEKDDVFLLISTRGAWPTSSRVEAIEPNPLVRRMRDSLARLRLTGVSQPGEERIVTFEFGGPGRAMRIICEFFSEGNIVLCDETGRILALLHSVEVRHRTLRVGETYTPPPPSDLSASEATLEDISAVSKTPLRAAKWLGRSVGLPSRYVERVFADAHIDPKSPGCELGEADVERLHSVLSSTVRRVIGGDHAPELISADGETTVNPIHLIDGARAEPDRPFEDLLDEALTSWLLEAGRSMRSGKTDRRVAELESQIGEQDRAIALVRQRAAEISETAQGLQRLASQGVMDLRDERAGAELSSRGAQLTRRRGRDVIRLADCDVGVQPHMSMHAAASALFDEAKVQAGAEASIVTRQKKMRTELESLQKRSTVESSSVGVTHIRKKAWYERYRWFTTTDGMLAVGGRDSSSNTSLIRKRMEEGDTVFHADVFGSPFFLLKGGRDAPATSVSEVAHATVCFSRAWREAMHGTEAYWIEPSQVKKAAPSGQYLPRGSFSIEGRRNLVRVPALRLAVGAVPLGDAYTVSCGPPQTIRSTSVCCSLIEPGGSTQADAAKRVKSAFTGMRDDLGGISLDEIARALPAGLSRVTESVKGDAGA